MKNTRRPPAVNATPGDTPASPSVLPRNAAAGKLPESRGRRDWKGGAAGTPLFFLRRPGIGVGLVLCHPNSRHGPNFPKKLLALSYGSDTRRPHWLTHLINLWMEIFFHLANKGFCNHTPHPRHLIWQWSSTLYGRPSRTLVVPSLGLPLPALGHQFA